MTRVLLPTVAKGVVVRRPAVMGLAERLQVDGSAIATMRALRARYGPEPLRLRITGRSVVLLLDPHDVERVLAESPEPFALATREKRAALEHFQPHGSLVSRGPARDRRRRFNEEVLRPGRIDAAAVARDEADLLVRHAASTGVLDWEGFAQAWWRLARRIVLGLGARNDDALTDDLKTLRQHGNWAYLHPRRDRLRERFDRRLRAHLDRAEPGSLASLADPDALREQVPHWLFAFDAAGIVTMRALALGGEGAAGILEAARLWPTTPVILRESTRPTRWHGTVLPRGTTFIVFTPYFHRDPDRLPYADRYAPEIWPHPDDPALVPFSAGPGVCPGRDLVLTTAGTTLDALRAGLSFPHLDAPLPATLDHFRLRFPVTRSAPARS
ncbi:cytochrome P450 [Actinosynnema sp. NPDC047251]